MKKFAVAIAALCLLALAKYKNAMTSTGVSIEAERITLTNDQGVICVVASGGGVDCDF